MSHGVAYKKDEVNGAGSGLTNGGGLAEKADGDVKIKESTKTTTCSAESSAKPTTCSAKLVPLDYDDGGPATAALVTGDSGVLSSLNGGSSSLLTWISLDNAKSQIAAQTKQLSEAQQRVDELLREQKRLKAVQVMENYDAGPGESSEEKMSSSPDQENGLGGDDVAREVLVDLRLHALDRGECGTIRSSGFTGCSSGM